MRTLVTVLIFATLFASSLNAEPRERSFEFTYVAELAVPEGAAKVQMWLPYPKSDNYQDVRLLSIQSSLPTKLYQEYTYRNSMLFLSMSAADLEPVRVEMSFRVTRREHQESDFMELEDPEGWIDSSASRWLRPDRLAPIDDSVREQAEVVVEGTTTVVDKARAIFDYTVDNVEYGGGGAGFLAVFTGFARAVGIPVKFQIGFPIPLERGEGQIEGYHCWAEFYVPGFGWVPVDASEANLHPDKRDYFFGAHDENRVEFTIGRDIKLNPLQAGEPLNYFIYPYAEIDGKPVSDIQREFFYKDLDLVAE